MVVGKIEQLHTLPSVGSRKRPKPKGIPIKDLQRVQLKPGDVLVARVARPLVPDSELARIKAQLERVFPDNQVIVSIGDIELFVVGNANS